MTHLSSINVLASDIAKLSKTLSTLAEQIESVPMQEPAEVAAKATKETVEAQKTQTESKKNSVNKEENASSSLDREVQDITIEDVRAVLAEKSQSGLTTKVKELLESFGACKLSAVKEADYGKLLEAAKKL